MSWTDRDRSQEVLHFENVIFGVRAFRLSTVDVLAVCQVLDDVAVLYVLSTLRTAGPPLTACSLGNLGVSHGARCLIHVPPLNPPVLLLPYIGRRRRFAGRGLSALSRFVLRLLSNELFDELNQLADKLLKRPVFVKKKLNVCGEVGEALSSLTHFRPEFLDRKRHPASPIRLWVGGLMPWLVVVAALGFTALGAMLLSPSHIPVLDGVRLPNGFPVGISGYRRLTIVLIRDDLRSPLRLRRIAAGYVRRRIERLQSPVPTVTCFRFSHTRIVVPTGVGGYEVVRVITGRNVADRWLPVRGFLDPVYGSVWILSITSVPGNSSLLSEIPRIPWARSRLRPDLSELLPGFGQCLAFLKHHVLNLANMLKMAITKLGFASPVARDVQLVAEGFLPKAEGGLRDAEFLGRIA